MSAIRYNPSCFRPEPGITLIEASAGTGKTHSITQMVCSLIAEGACRIDEVLVLTFTETATQELRGRIRMALAEAIQNEVTLANERAITNLSNALDSFESASIFTIHGFCNRILREFSVEAGLGSEFAILKNPKLIQEQLQLEIARTFQKTAELNPFLPIGMRTLDLKSNFISQSLLLKDAADIRALPTDHADFLKNWFQGLFVDLKRAWKQDAHAIRAELLSSTAPINRRKALYKIDGLTSMLDRMETTFSSGNIYLDFLTELELLSYGSLTGSTVIKKNKTLNPLGFYHLCDQVSKTLLELEKRLVGFILDLREQHTEKLVFQEQQLRFDDLLTFSQKIVCEPTGRFSSILYHQYQVGLIDEFQDTDPVQLSILEAIFLNPPAGQAQRPLILIGDPKQAIYGFRGGDIFTYHSAKSRAVKSYFLDTNWRSSPAINEGINELLQTTATPFLYDWINYQPVATASKNSGKCLSTQDIANPQETFSGIHWIELEAETTDHQTIKRLAQDIKHLLSARCIIHGPKTPKALNPSDITVLVPGNKVGANIHEALGIIGVPSTIFGGASVFQTSEARQLYTILDAVQNPRDFALLRGAVAGNCFDPSLTQADPNDLSGPWAAIVQSFSTAFTLWQSKGLSQALALLQTQFAWRENLSKSSASHRALANHHHLLNLVLEQEATHPHDVYSLLRWFREQIEDPDSKDQDQLLQLDTDSDAVTIMTMHKSKGLEFPVVFIPFLPKEKAQTSYPNQHHHPKTGALCTNFSKKHISESNQRTRSTEIKSELLRTLYVAITRAELFCQVYLSPNKLDQTIIDQWLPTGKDLQQRLAALTTKANPLPAQAQQPQAHRPCGSTPLRQPFPSLPTQSVLTHPQSAPVAPAPVCNLSFTGIVKGATEHDRPHTDEPILFSYTPADPRTAEAKASLPLSIFDFDKGTHAGLMFHELLQYIDFSNQEQWTPQIISILQQFGYSTQQWSPVLFPWLQALAEAPVLMPDQAEIRMSDLIQENTFRETEFSYPITWNDTVWEQLNRLFSHSPWVAEINYQLPSITEIRNNMHAFVNGIVDFWFFQNNKVYLIDWKSNHLGNETIEYHQANLQLAMAQHHYHLQYLLYICAINRYLRLVNSRYDYEIHFGGVGYCFLRGLKSNDANAGWFTTLPPSELILEMESILYPKNNNPGGVR